MLTQRPVLDINIIYNKDLETFVAALWNFPKASQRSHYAFYEEIWVHCLRAEFIGGLKVLSMSGFNPISIGLLGGMGQLEGSFAPEIVDVVKRALYYPYSHEMTYERFTNIIMEGNPDCLVRDIALFKTLWFTDEKNLSIFSKPVGFFKLWMLKQKDNPKKGEILQRFVAAAIDEVHYTKAQFTEAICDIAVAKVFLDSQQKELQKRVLENLSRYADHSYQEQNALLEMLEKGKCNFPSAHQYYLEYAQALVQIYLQESARSQQPQASCNAAQILIRLFSSLDKSEAFYERFMPAVLRYIMKGEDSPRHIRDSGEQIIFYRIRFETFRDLLHAVCPEADEYFQRDRCREDCENAADFYLTQRAKSLVRAPSIEDDLPNAARERALHLISDITEVHKKTTAFNHYKDRVRGRVLQDGQSILDSHSSEEAALRVKSHVEKVVKPRYQPYLTDEAKRLSISYTALIDLHMRRLALRLFDYCMDKYTAEVSPDATEAFEQIQVAYKRIKSSLSGMTITDSDREFVHTMSPAVKAVFHSNEDIYPIALKVLLNVHNASGNLFVKKDKIDNAIYARYLSESGVIQGSDAEDFVRELVVLMLCVINEGAQRIAPTFSDDEFHLIAAIAEVATAYEGAPSEAFSCYPGTVSILGLGVLNRCSDQSLHVPAFQDEAILKAAAQVISKRFAHYLSPDQTCSQGLLEACVAISASNRDEALDVASATGSWCSPYTGTTIHYTPQLSQLRQGFVQSLQDNRGQIIKDIENVLCEQYGPAEADISDAQAVIEYAINDLGHPQIRSLLEGYYLRAFPEGNKEGRDLFSMPMFKMSDTVIKNNLEQRLPSGLPGREARILAQAKIQNNGYQIKRQMALFVFMNAHLFLSHKSLNLARVCTAIEQAPLTALKSFEQAMLLPEALSASAETAEQEAEMFSFWEVFDPIATSAEKRNEVIQAFKFAYTDPASSARHTLFSQMYHALYTHHEKWIAKLRALDMPPQQRQYEQMVEFKRFKNDIEHIRDSLFGYHVVSLPNIFTGSLPKLFTRDRHNFDFTTRRTTQMSAAAKSLRREYEIAIKMYNRCQISWDKLSQVISDLFDISGFNEYIYDSVKVSHIKRECTSIAVRPFWYDSRLALTDEYITNHLKPLLDEVILPVIQMRCDPNYLTHSAASSEVASPPQSLDAMLKKIEDAAVRLQACFGLERFPLPPMRRTDLGLAATTPLDESAKRLFETFLTEIERFRYIPWKIRQDLVAQFRELVPAFISFENKNNSLWQILDSCEFRSHILPESYEYFDAIMQSLDAQPVTPSAPLGPGSARRMMTPYRDALRKQNTAEKAREATHVPHSAPASNVKARKL